VFTRKENATLAQQIEILDWHHKHGKKQIATAQHFAPIYPNLKLKQPLISSWLKEEVKCYDFFLFYFTFYTSSSFSNLAYIITLIPGHESLIYDSHYLSPTHVPRFDSSCTIIRYDSSVALTHTYSI
jgi:hypothetical protein